MSRIHRLPSNFIGKEDREKLESFAGHTVARGRATRWHWAKDAGGDDLFEIYRGGPAEVLAARIRRDREADAFAACDAGGRAIASGVIEHVFAELDAHFAALHGEDADPGTPNG